MSDKDSQMDLDYERLHNHAVELGNILAPFSKEYDKFPITEGMLFNFVIPGYLKVAKDRIEEVNKSG